MLAVIGLACLHSCASAKKFACPVSSGGIIQVDIQGAEIAKPSNILSIYSLDGQVISSTSGKVYQITEKEGKFCVIVKENDRLFTYDNLSTCDVRQAQQLVKGQSIGHLNKGDCLFFAVIRGGLFIDPRKQLTCTVIAEPYKLNNP